MDACALLEEELTEDMPVEAVIVRTMALAKPPDEDEETTEVGPLPVHPQDASRSFVIYEAPVPRALKRFYRERCRPLLLAQDKISLAKAKTPYQKGKVLFRGMLARMRENVRTTWDLPWPDSSRSGSEIRE